MVHVIGAAAAIILVALAIILMRGAHDDEGVWDDETIRQQFSHTRYSRGPRSQS